MHYKYIFKLNRWQFVQWLVCCGRLFNFSRSGICIMKAESNSPLTLFTRALERWENEGGRVAQVNPRQGPTLLSFVGSPRARKNLETAKKDSHRMLPNS
jgi:hypothetical protein